MTMRPPAGLIDRFFAWRDGLLASHRFQRLAVRFPLTRPLARRRARQLFDLCTGFVYSQVLLACVRLKLFAALKAAGPMSAEALAERLDMPVQGMERLLLAARSLGLLARRQDGRFALGELGAALLGNPGLEAMIEHHALLYADLKDPVALLRGDGPQAGLNRYWAYAQTDRDEEIAPARVADYSRLMAATQPMIAAEVLDAYPMHRHRTLLDIGGGEGAFLTAAAARAPDLRLVLFDLPAVVERARPRFEATGMARRSKLVGGDFRHDALPEGADLVSLVRILHDHDDATVLALLQRIRRAIAPGGTLLIAEPMAGTPGAEAMADAYFGFYLLAMGRGRARREEELFDLLREAGFSTMRTLPTLTPLLTRVVSARLST